MNRQEQRIKELVLGRVARCGQCGAGYSHQDINVLGHKDDLWFLMLICGQCHQSVGVAAVVKEQMRATTRESRSDGLPLVPAVEDAVVPWPREPVCGDDVAAVRDFLRDFDGDFKRLFGERV